MWLIEKTSDDEQVFPTYLTEFKSESVVYTNKEKTNYDIEIISEKNKICLSPSENPYHFLYDFLGQIFEIEKRFDLENLELIIRLDPNYHVDSTKEFIADLLNKLNVKYHFIEKKSRVLSNNFSEISNQEQPYRAAYNLIYDRLLSIYPSKLISPDKKVYVSRIGYPDQGNTICTELEKRIDDELKLIEHFIQNGYEIHYRGKLGESSIIEDIIYFRDVKTIAGLSGAGLVNAIFMPPGGNLIEIAVPILSAFGGEDDLFPERYIQARHLFHPATAFEKGHMMYQVPIKSKSAEEAISKIKDIGEKI